MMVGVTRVGLLAFLVTLSQAAALQASLSILQRVVFLSWDNPSTQIHDELAAQSSPYADTSGETLAHQRLAATTTTAFVAWPAHLVVRRTVLAARVTRSPPAT